MILNKKTNRFKPIFKKFLKLNLNLQNNNKLLNFKKKKWKKLIQIYKKKLKLFRKIKLNDYNQYFVSRYSGIKFSYKKNFKNILQQVKIFRILYGNLMLKVLLNKKLNILNFIIFLKLFESRLDIVLFRANFGLSTRQIVQLIYQGNIFVNGKLIKIKSFILKSGDIISIKKLNYYKFFNYAILNSVCPIYPKHLIINYKTMEIVFNFFNSNNSLYNFYNIELEKIINYKY